MKDTAKFLKMFLRMNGISFKEFGESSKNILINMTLERKDI